MRSKKNIVFLTENGISSSTLTKMTDRQFNILVEKFKKMKKEESKENWTKQMSNTVTYSAPIADAANGLTLPKDSNKQSTVSVKGGNIKVTQTDSEISEDDTSVDIDDASAGQYTQDKHQVQAPDGMDDEGDKEIDSEENLATEGVIKEKFESKAQQGLFWARCNKCSSKKCKWCKMVKEFSDSTTKKEYKTMPEKKHPEKTVKYKKTETNESLKKFLEKKFSKIVEDSIKPKMSKKDIIEALKKKSESFIIRRPKKVTMFSNEAPMKLPIGKMFSIGKK